ncbi:MAG: L,D-transpeptidase [Zoogloeaceae bacterium]|jgi:lipoprotein-anchoring transpeptidase ErfK/SrfK|nr:L,D-transpeptidase [Zoogloeaceae bacterium]
MHIHISLARQTLTLLDDRGRACLHFPVSTAANGAGEREGSNQTPRGRHIVRSRIGAGCPLYAVFSRRRPTGEIWSPALEAVHPGKDWILTRILWLSGIEPGFNRGRNAAGQCVDSQRRYIYIHGCGEFAPMREPHSHGCIRMRNRDMLALFDSVPVYTTVTISGN